MFLAANLDKNAVILEQNEKIAKKLLISGGGKCNISNENIQNDCYLCDDYELLEKTLGQFSYKDNLRFFEKIRFKKIRNKQFFADSSQQVLDVLLNKIRAKIHLGKKVLKITKENDYFRIFTNNGEFRAKKVVIASGGISYPSLGVSDLALSVARDFDIKYKDFSPALVPLTLQKDEFFMKELSGISLDVRINDRFSGSMLFTHKGISGPSVLSASLFWEKGKIKIDFLNDFRIDFANSKQASTHLNLPKAFVKAYLRANNLEDKTMKTYNENERKIINRLQNYCFAPAGNLGFSKAEVCKGGVLLGSLSENYESIKGLFFIGECVNVTGMLGGFNIHFAFASAKKLANYLNKLA